MGEDEHGRFHTSPQQRRESLSTPATPAVPKRKPWSRYVQRAMHGWWRFSRGMTLGVRAVVLTADAHVLLLRHTYVPGWQFPGGGVEPGETLREALARELEEEAAVHLAGEPALHGIFLNSHASRRDHVAVYVIEQYRAGVPQVPNREIAEVGFFPLDSLPADTTPGTRRRLHEIAGRLPPAPRW